MRVQKEKGRIKYESGARLGGRGEGKRMRMECLAVAKVAVWGIYACIPLFELIEIFEGIVVAAADSE